MKDLRAVAQRFAEARRAYRHDHELLHVDAVVRVGASVDHVHQRHGKHHFARTAEIAIERQRRFLGRRLGDRGGNRKDGVCAQSRFVVGAVQLDHGPIDECLLGRVEPDDRFADLRVDVLDGFLHAFAVVTGRITVAQLDGLARAGGRTRRNRGAAADARFEHDIGFDRGVAAGVEDLPRDDVDDGAHAEASDGSVKELRFLIIFSRIPSRESRRASRRHRARAASAAVRASCRAAMRSGRPRAPWMGRGASP